MTQPGIPNEYAISTTCYGSRLRTIEDQAFASVAMGFRRLELGLSEAPVPLNGFEESQRETGICVRSMIAGCLDPLREHMSGAELCSTKPEARERGLGSVRRHARIALHYGCPTLILRGFRIEDPALVMRARSLHTRLQLGQPGEELQTEAQELEQELLRKGHRQLEHLCRSIHTLCAEFEGLKFAVEATADLADLLSFEAVGWILDDLARHHVGYWHNCGGVHQRSRCGLDDHGRWLDAYAPRMSGCHLHDATTTEAEMPPGSGEVDFALLRSYLPADAERVLEIASSHGRAEILAAIRFLMDKGI